MFLIILDDDFIFIIARTSVLLLSYSKSEISPERLNVNQLLKDNNNIQFQGYSDNTRINQESIVRQLFVIPFKGTCEHQMEVLVELNIYLSKLTFIRIRREL